MFSCKHQNSTFSSEIEIIPLIVCFNFSHWNIYTIIFSHKNILYSTWLGEHLRTWRRVQSLVFHRPLVLWRGCPELSGFTLRWDNPLLSLFFQMSDLEYSAIYCFTCEMTWFCSINVTKKYATGEVACSKISCTECFLETSQIVFVHCSNLSRKSRKTLLAVAHYSLCLSWQIISQSTENVILRWQESFVESTQNIFCVTQKKIFARRT